MTAEIVPHRPAAVPATTEHDDAAAKLIRWAQAAQAAHTLAQSLVKTAFCPKDYRGKAEEATAAILAGAELGFDPMASLRTFDNIQGTAAPKAITIRAVVQSHGHELDIVEESETKAVARYRRRGTADYKFVEWTIEQARKAGLPGRNPNWNTQPRTMLVARATAEAGRRCASDALLGIPYSSEELYDHPEVVAAPPAQRVTAKEITAKRNPRAQQRLPQPPADEPADTPVGEGQTVIDADEPPPGVGEPYNPAGDQ
jgi:hypothetical protein